MTVQQLIEKLQTLDGNTRITVYHDGGFGGGWDYGDIESIKTEKEHNGKELENIYSFLW